MPLNCFRLESKEYYISFFTAKNLSTIEKLFLFYYLLYFPPKTINIFLQIN